MASILSSPWLVAVLLLSSTVAHAFLQMGDAGVRPLQPEFGIDRNRIEVDSLIPLGAFINSGDSSSLWAAALGQDAAAYDLEVTDHYTDDHTGTTVAHARQTYEGIPIVNAVGNLNVRRDGGVHSSYHRFVPNNESLSLIHGSSFAEFSVNDAITAITSTVGYPADAECGRYPRVCQSCSCKKRTSDGVCTDFECVEADCEVAYIMCNPQPHCTCRDEDSVLHNQCRRFECSGSIKGIARRFYKTSENEIEPAWDIELHEPNEDASMKREWNGIVGGSGRVLELADRIHRFYGSTSSERGIAAPVGLPQPTDGDGDGDSESDSQDSSSSDEISRVEDGETCHDHPAWVKFCVYWVRMGFCTSDPEYMKKYCRLSCQFCSPGPDQPFQTLPMPLPGSEGDDETEAVVEGVSSSVFATERKPFKYNVWVPPATDPDTGNPNPRPNPPPTPPRPHPTHPAPRPTDPPNPACRDHSAWEHLCKYWVMMKFCETDPKFMRKYCRKSCKFCTPLTLDEASSSDQQEDTAAADAIDMSRHMVEEHINPKYAPFGWQGRSDGSISETTEGNNVRAKKPGYAAPRARDGVFDYPIDFSKDPTFYIEACSVQLFYSINWMHDVHYQHGFDEKAGNFQEENYGRGGNGGDAVRADCQASGRDNAAFATPPDGTPGHMYMFMWDLMRPRKSGSFDMSVVAHEFTHGVSNRLTGGPNAYRCLRTTEAGGMGEGWGDFFATLFHLTPTMRRNDAIPMGVYVAGRGIRHYPYSSDTSINPTMYSYMRRYHEVHNVGEIWAQILLECYWEVAERYPLDMDWLNGNGGNNIMHRIVLHGMKLQPCNPSLIEARDAILEAASTEYGEHDDIVKLIWRGFAKRGLGLSATRKGVDGFDVPDWAREE